MEYFYNKTVLITGAAGFIGSHLCDAVLAEGASVIGVDNFLTGAKKNLDQLQDNPRFSFVRADVSATPESYLPVGRHIDCILHFASPASPPRYQAHPVETYLVNSIATHNLLQYLKYHNPAGRFLFASTSEIYGDPKEHPQNEGYWGNVNPNGVRSCYDEAKRLGETICGVHERDFGLDVRIVRIFNTYGPRMDLNDGRVIPNLIKEALDNQKLSIHGDGTQTRSYCYVSDLVRGIIALAGKDGLKGITMNLGNQSEYSVLETAHAVWKEVHPNQLEPEFDFKPLPADDPMRRKPDITRAQETLGWNPIVDFTDGLKQTVSYFRSIPPQPNVTA